MLCPCARTVPLFSKHQLLLGLAFAFVQATGALAADPTSDKNAIFAAAKDAIAHGEVDKTYLEGFAIKKTSFEELLPEGAVLIGFDIGLGPFVKDDVIYALRPIYLTAKGEIKGRDVGKLTTGRPQDKVKRVIQIKAKPGYAVAKIRMQHGLGIECLRFTFEELTANGLDSERSYSSGWIGTYHPEREEKVLSGEGGPILGIFGNKDDKQVLALGLIHFPDLTAPPMPPVKERVKATAPEETKQAEPAGNNVEEPAPKEEALPEATSGSLSWLPFVVFGVVAIPAFLVLMLVLGKKKQVVSDQPPRRNRVRKVPPAKTEINDNLQADD
ncbi:MAG TPA: hypothetical protein VGZ47_10650, partial [Gemmataceae bacterium]|nr:hypothetical protein [Gemmataceae bacterium]